MYQLKEIIQHIESFAPPTFQENYDNSGLIVGNPEMEIRGAVICLDALETILDEAISKKYNLIIAHHPIIFSGLKSITGKNNIEKIVIKAIKNDIAIYAAHTNLDNMYWGVNKKITEKLNLKQASILQKQNSNLKKLYVYVPKTHAETLQSALFEAGAGQIGNYSHCSFNTFGVGTFKANEHANPYVGQANKTHFEEEQKIEVIFSKEKQSKILQAMKNVHPYEEIAHEIISIENANPEIGAGMIGELEEEITSSEFLFLLKKQFYAEGIRYTPFEKKIKKIAVCGGSGSFLLTEAIKQGADAFVSSDFKYHQFFDANEKLMIADIGHYESEQFTNEIFYEILSKKIPNFALHITSVNTNPIKYYK